MFQYFNSGTVHTGTVHTGTWHVHTFHPSHQTSICKQGQPSSETQSFTRTMTTTCRMMTLLTGHTIRTECCLVDDRRQHQDDMTRRCSSARGALGRYLPPAGGSSLRVAAPIVGANGRWGGGCARPEPRREKPFPFQRARVRFWGGQATPPRQQHGANQHPHAREGPAQFEQLHQSTPPSAITTMWVPLLHHSIQCLLVAAGASWRRPSNRGAIYRRCVSETARK